MIATNVTGLIHLTQHFVRAFKAQGSGMIVNLGSIAGKEAYVGGASADPHPSCSLHHEDHLTHLRKQEPDGQAPFIARPSLPSMLSPSL